MQILENTSKKYPNGSKWMSNNDGYAIVIGKSDRLTKRKNGKHEKSHYIVQFEDGSQTELMVKELKSGHFRKPKKEKCRICKKEHMLGEDGLCLTCGMKYTLVDNDKYQDDETGSIYTVKDFKAKGIPNPENTLRFDGKEQSEILVDHIKDLHDVYKSDSLLLEDENKDLLKENKKLRKSLQNSRDNLRVLRKEVRDSHREEKDAHEMFEDIKQQLQTPTIFDTIPKVYVEKLHKKSVILQINDVHFNYDDDTALEMANSYLDSVVKEFDEKLPDEIVFAFVGDLLNHEKYSKKYTNKFKRGKSVTKCFDMLSFIMSYFVEEYPKISFKAVNVVGNESDLNEMFMNENEAGYDNLDYMVYSMLKARFSNVVNFLNEGNEIIFSFEIQGKTVGMNHGYFQLKLSQRNNIEDYFHKTREAIRVDTGKEIDFLLTAHIHQSIGINNKLFRGSSWEGSNSYSKYALGIANSYRNQNMIVIQDGRYHCRLLVF